MLQSSAILYRRRPLRRSVKIRIALVAVLLAAIVAFAGGGWYLSNLVKDGGLVPDYEDPEYDLKVLAVGEGQVTLGVTGDTDEEGDWRRDGLWGLERIGGYDQVGGILELTEEHVVRELIPIGVGPKIGDMARLDSFTFPDDPVSTFGIAFEEVHYSSPLGDFPAWLVRGSVDHWAIFVHGKGADRREAMRILPAVTDAGLTSLIITYRNDEHTPMDPTGFHGYGQTEWIDLEAAAKFAISNGAQDIVLVGYSMGGAIVVSFLFESTLAESVRGAILDAPMLDFGATVDLGAREKGYPGLFSTVAKSFTGIRFDVDWDALDYLRRVDELSVPILLFHGDDDDTVPVETSDALAKARPDLVTYIRVANTGHVNAWNTDHAAYERAVDDFLRSLFEP